MTTEKKTTNKNISLRNIVIYQSLNKEIFLNLAAESKKKGITIQALIRNICAEYVERKETPIN